MGEVIFLCVPISFTGKNYNRKKSVGSSVNEHTTRTSPFDGQVMTERQMSMNVRDYLLEQQQQKRQLQEQGSLVMLNRPEFHPPGVPQVFHRLE